MFEVVSEELNLSLFLMIGCIFVLNVGLFKFGEMDGSCILGLSTVWSSV